MVVEEIRTISIVKIFAELFVQVKTEKILKPSYSYFKNSVIWYFFVVNEKLI